MKQKLIIYSKKVVVKRVGGSFLAGLLSVG